MTPSRAHDECSELAICPCRDNGQRALLDQLYEAIHGHEPPAMPIPPAELWGLLIRQVEQLSLVAAQYPAVTRPMGTP